MKKLTPEEKYWQSAEQRAKGLIAEQIVSQIPFRSDLVFELSEEVDNRYDDVIEDVQENYEDELPETSHELAEIIFVEYMKRLIRDLETDLASWQ